MFLCWPLALAVVFCVCFKFWQHNVICDFSKRLTTGVFFYWNCMLFQRLLWNFPQKSLYAPVLCCNVLGPNRDSCADLMRIQHMAHISPCVWCVYQHFTQSTHTTVRCIASKTWYSDDKSTEKIRRIWNIYWYALATTRLLSTKLMLAVGSMCKPSYQETNFTNFTHLQSWQLQAQPYVSNDEHTKQDIWKTCAKTSQDVISSP